MLSAEMFINNLMSPPILFFLLGVTAGFLKSDLKFPDSAGRAFGVYLMTAIGFKGGVALSHTDILSGEVLKTGAAAIILSFILPFIFYPLLRYLTKTDKVTGAAVAACYGSVSMVTFVTATGFLASKNITYHPYLVTALALMEAPAILSGLYIAHRVAPETVAAGERATPRLSREIFANGAILLLAGSLLIGALTGDAGKKQLEGFLITPFQGVLAFFLLEMGLQAVRKLKEAGKFDKSVVAFGVIAPPIGAVIGLTVSKLIGLSAGDGMLFTVLAASASYIAVPAAMRLALPQAASSTYVTLSLGITFPFNVIVGIPIYYEAARYLL